MASRSRRGFAAMDPEKQREIASMGGRAAHAKGTAHEFTEDEARKAGRRGGRAVSRDRDYMAEIGRRGGLSSHASEESANGTARPRTAAAAAQNTARRTKTVRAAAAKSRTTKARRGGARSAKTKGR